MRVSIENFLSSEECDSFIKLAEEAGMVEASITTPDGSEVRTDYRNNDRYMFDDHGLASKLYDRLSSYLGEDKEWKPCGLNERFKIYRYVPGQNFAMHTDSQFSRNEKERSFQTILIYLNDDYEGGETEFFGMDTIPPKKGMGILFMHHLLHEGMPVISGVKYALRTDVMYKYKE